MPSYVQGNFDQLKIEDFTAANDLPTKVITNLTATTNMIKGSVVFKDFRTKNF